MAHTDLERTGSFESSDSVLNQLQHNIIWSFLTNYHSYPEDCPHREKMGWTGDAQLVAEMALYNFDMKQSYLKWLDDFTDSMNDFNVRFVPDMARSELLASVMAN